MAVKVVKSKTLDAIIESLNLDLINAAKRKAKASERGDNLGVWHWFGATEAFKKAIRRIQEHRTDAITLDLCNKN